jgi:hypothetical protein
LDQDFVANTACDADKDCDSQNERFLEKCLPYQDCGTSDQPFKCDLKFHRCLSTRQFRNCKNDDVCTELEHLFLCENGLCQNITSAFDCEYEESQHPVNCKDKRNCITLNGLFDCHDGQCAKVSIKVLKSFSDNFPTAPAQPVQNVILSLQ